jgi:NAD(P)-dependent dehydrogenase (short-subunit alcohol dehydrogenase family)
MEITGKTAVVTGAASGIGLGIATALARAGARVALADIQKAAAEEAAHRLAAAGAQVLAIGVDVTKDDSVAAAARTVEAAWGKLHVACNNAGVPMHGTRLADVTLEDWRFVIGVNVWGVIHGIRHFLPAIQRHGEGGWIVNTASVAGFQNRRGTDQGPYSMTKYAVLSLSEELEIELQGTNIGVSVLAPGPVSTNIARGARNRPADMGGALVREKDEAILAERLRTQGIPPIEVGERVVRAIREQQFHAFVSVVPLDVIAARHRRIEAAIERDQSQARPISARSASA